MSSLVIEDIVLNVPAGNSLDERLEEIDCPTIKCVDITVSGTFNGQAIVGTLVFTDSTQTLKNKSFVDNLNSFVDAVDPTIQVFFDAAGTTGTTSTLQFVQTANRTYTVPDSGANCEVVTTEGTQTVNGAKTFTNLIVSTLQIDAIDEATLNHGVYIDNIRLREDVLTTPAMTLDSISPVGVATDITLAIIPKGLGAIIAAVPDNTSTGGNARGNNAVDFQIIRSAATQVASGNNSCVLGGESNTASAQDSVVCGGTGNTSSGTASVTAGGTGNTSGGSNSSVGGGNGNNASGNFSTIPGGDSCSAASDYSSASGRRAKAVNVGAHVVSDSTNADFSSTSADQWNARFANGYRAVGGKFAWNDVDNLYTSGTGNTIGATITGIYTFATATNTTYFYTYNINGATSAGDTAVFTGMVRVKNVGGTLTIGTPFNVWDDADVAINTATVSVVASGTSVIIQATGAAGQTIGWSGSVREILSAF